MIKRCKGIETIINGKMEVKTMNKRISLIIALFAMGFILFSGGMKLNAEEIKGDYKGWDEIFANDYMPDQSYNMTQQEKWDEDVRLQMRKLLPRGYEELFSTNESKKAYLKKLNRKKVRPHDPDFTAFSDGGI